MANLNQRLVLVLRWKGGVLLDKTGRWPLIIFSVPLILAIYWGGYYDHTPSNCRIHSMRCSSNYVHP